MVCLTHQPLSRSPRLGAIRPRSLGRCLRDVAAVSVIATGIGSCTTRQIAPVGAPATTVRLSSLPPRAAEGLLFLEQAGVSPEDTVVTFDASRGRTVVVRHAPPDNAIFAMIAIPADSGASGQTTLSISHIPGRYGVRLEAIPGLPRGSTLTFSYAVHFLPPAGAMARYSNVTRFARALGVVRLRDDGLFQFLAERRPAADMLRAPIDEPGEFLVAAPR